MIISPSRIKVFGDCANQYKYKHLLKLEGEQNGANTALGSIMHFALQVYELYGQNLALALATFDHYWDNPALLNERIDFYYPRTSHEGLRERAHTMLTRHHELSPWKTGGTLIGTELSFEVPLGTHTLRGIIDRVDLRGTGSTRRLEVIDYKTGGYVPDKLRYNVQFTSYLYALTRPEFWAGVPGWEHFWMEAQTLPQKGIWYHARNNKAIDAGTRTDADYRRLLLAVDQIEAAIDNNIFPLTIDGVACGWCAWIDVCGTEVEAPYPVAVKTTLPI